MFFQTESVMPHMTRIRSIADTMMYLIEGTDRALLIDTGCGVGDLKGLIDSLTDKPVTVLLTHGHVDHAMGTHGFENVYISLSDRDVYAEHSQDEMRRGYVVALPEEAWGPFDHPAEADWTIPLPFDQLRPLNVGDAFDLGGITAHVTEGSGHTPGCVTVLLPELRTLILGDACNEFTFLFEKYSSSVTSFRDMLVRLKAATDGKYDCVLFFHWSGEGDVNMIQGVIDVCNDVLSGKSENIPFQSFIKGNAVIARAMDEASLSQPERKPGNVVYNPGKLCD